MSYTQIMHLMQRALSVAAQVALPALLISLAVGVIVSVLQAATSVQEMSLSFIPKVIALGVALLLLGGWMLGRLVDFSRELLLILPQAVR